LDIFGIYRLRRLPFLRELFRSQAKIAGRHLAKTKNAPAIANVRGAVGWCKKNFVKVGRTTHGPPANLGSMPSANWTAASI
jgi:hypothetical protein